MTDKKISYGKALTIVKGVVAEAFGLDINDIKDDLDISGLDISFISLISTKTGRMLHVQDVPSLTVSKLAQYASE